MRDGAILFLICVVAIGAIAMWMLYVDRAPRGFASQSADAPQGAAETSSTPAPKPPLKPAKPKVPAEAAPAEAAAPQAAPVPEIQATLATAPAPAPAAPPRPFPSVDQIAVGIPEDTITNEYGDPALSATTSDRGHMVETFVYARDGRRDVTVISLEDGKVASAYSRPRAASAVAMPPPLRRRGS